MKRWADAQSVFTGALKRDPQNAMLLNARGAVLSARQDWDSALLDLEAATKANPRLADAFASLGAVWIKKKTGAEGALAAFGQALEISPGFALALNGRGVAQFATGAWPEAAEAFIAAREKCDCLEAAVENLNASVKMLNDIMAEVDRKAGSRPGGSLKAWVSETKANAYKALSTAFGLGSKYVKEATFGTSGLNATMTRGGMRAAANSMARLSEWHKNAAVVFKSQPGGVSSEDLSHSHVDSGRWLVTGYGLGYDVAEVQPPPEVSVGSAK
jgi:hypothetical protein